MEDEPNLVVEDNPDLVARTHPNIVVETIELARMTFESCR